jgi:hypothetical protein
LGSLFTVFQPLISTCPKSLRLFILFLHQLLCLVRLVLLKQQEVSKLIHCVKILDIYFILFSVGQFRFPLMSVVAFARILCILLWTLLW